MADAFSRQGGKVIRLDRFWEPPALEPRAVRVYGPDTFVLVVQQKLTLELCSPDDRLLASVPSRFLRRRVEVLTLAEVLSAHFPTFVKPVVPKQFRAKVYRTADELRSEFRGLASTVEVFRSEVVTLAAEARAFVLHRRVLDLQVYEGKSSVAELAKFVSEISMFVPLPPAVAVDVGLDRSGNPVLIEFNAAWGAGLNGCDPDLVLPAIIAASGPRD